VRVLLDTHALLWSLEGGDSFSAKARDTILDLSNEILVSAASAWEISIKRALGKLEAPANLAEAIQDAGFLPRNIHFADCAQLGQLPEHHRDPFDRMLVSQALVDGVPIVTCDAQIRLYGVQTIW
jgi:PIN domain nuclease of toxin-antitoxin system